MKMKENKELVIKILTEKLEKLTGQKVVLEEERLSVFDKTFTWVKDAIRVNKLQFICKVIKAQNMIMVNCMEKGSEDKLKKIQFALQSKGFEKLNNKKTNNKTYINLKFGKENVYVLIETK